MCTIDSLERIWQVLKFPMSSWSVLIGCLLLSVQGRSVAFEVVKNDAAFAINVQAPADITIHIRSLSRCDTTIQLPPATFSGNCSPILTFQTYSTYGSLSSNGGLFYFTPGVFKVYYRIEDNCRMSGLDSMTVTIHDAELPQVVCAPAQSISLTESGFAEAPAYIFDGGSSDNCHHLYFKIKRMFATQIVDCISPNNPANAFDDVVRFCCADADSSRILLILRVYDVFPGYGPVSDSLLRGRYIDCMVEALVRDKIPPEIICPPNLTVQCGVHLDSLLKKAHVHLFDNCGLLDIDTLDEDNLDACGSGTFIRSYIAEDRHGLISECRQTITINRTHNFDGFNPAHLTWPPHTMIYACRVDLDTIHSGAPIVNDDKCALLQITSQDDVYQFNHGGVCAKVLRHWKVINWCKYNPLFQPNPRVPENGYYVYTQEIKIFDTIAPVLFGVNDTIVGIQTSNCEAGNVILPDIQAMDCGSTGNISFRFEVDYFSDQTINRAGNGKNASGLFPVGRHLINYFAKDSCHNEGSIQIQIEVRDSKNPYAIAMYGVSSSLTLMANGAMTSVNAKLFNNKSSDNCTEAKNLRYSFSSDMNDTIRIYTCDSIGKREVKLVVWDEAGNSSEVYTFIVIDDVFSNCPTSIQKYNIIGSITTKNNQAVTDVQVKFTSSQIEKTVESNRTGNFIFSDIPGSAQAQIYSSLSKNYADGLSTADIIQIQRHILGIEIFDDPLKHIAADIDMSGTVTTRDVVHLRNLILGRVTELAHKKSYVFINPEYVFQDNLFPLPEIDACQYLMIQNIFEDKKVSIQAIKLGDVNLSYSVNGFSSENAIKSETVYYQLDAHSVKYYLENHRDLTGVQFGIVLDGLCINELSRIKSSLPLWSEENYSISGNVLRIAYHSSDIINYSKNTPLFEIEFKNSLLECQPTFSFLRDFEQAVYTPVSQYNIEGLLQMWNHSTNAFYIENYAPNPFDETVQIELRTNQDTHIATEIISAEQKILTKLSFKLKQGLNKIEIPRIHFGAPGIYYLKFSQENQVQHIKLIAL
ncbi:MAG: T9SS type A sorting domain-containing protein [Saprospiraceae bacterium]|nr:T9SS type A sorting domain-containing protein [Saprospiraceae bacterium]